METIYRKVSIQERLPKQDGDYITNLGWNRYRIRKPNDRIEYQLWVHEIDTESGMPLKWWLEEIELSNDVDWQSKYQTAVQQKINLQKEVDRLREKYEPQGFANEYKGA